MTPQPFEVAMNTIIGYVTTSADAGNNAAHPVWNAIRVVDETVTRREQRHQQAVRKNQSYRRAIRQLQRAHLMLQTVTRNMALDRDRLRLQNNNLEAVVRTTRRGKVE